MSAMASILSLFWSQPTPTIQSTTTPTSSITVPTPTNTNHTDHDEFIMVDTDGSHATPTSAAHSRSTSSSFTLLENPPSEQPHLTLTPAISQATTMKRSCMLYGQHIRGGLRPYVPTALASAVPASPAAKRSFADILKAKVQDTPATMVGYAQDAASVANERLLSKIEQLEQAQNALGYKQEEMVDEDSVEAILASIDYSSPPLRPTQPLTKEGERMYHEQTEWTLDVEAPNSKRSKRSSSPTILIPVQVKLAKKSKGKNKPGARSHDKAINRARDSKQSW